MSWEIVPDENLPDENGIYCKTVYADNIPEINIDANSSYSQTIHWNIPDIPANAVIHSVTFSATAYSLYGYPLEDLTIVVGTRIFYANGGSFDIEVDLGTDHRKCEIQLYIYTGTAKVERLELGSKLIKVRYSLVDVQDELCNSNICLGDVQPKAILIGDDKIKKVCLGNKPIYELISSEDIIAAYSAVKPKKMVLCTVDEFNNNGGLEYSKSLTGLNLNETHMYYVTYGDGYDNEMSYLTASLSNPDRFTLEYYYKYLWSGDEIKVYHNRVTGTTDCYFYMGYSSVEEDITLLDYSETTVYEQEYLNLSEAQENCEIITIDGISYLCRKSSSYAPTTLYCEQNYNMKNIYKIPDSVTDMTNAFRGCLHLNNMVCGKNVTIMDQAFFNCRRLGPVVYCEENVTSMHRTFYNSFYSHGFTAYLMSPNITNMRDCFRNQYKNTLSKIYVPRNSTTLQTCLQTDSTTSITGVSMTFTYNSDYDRYEEETQNIHIYPVDDVRALYNEYIEN